MRRTAIPPIYSTLLCNDANLIPTEAIKAALTWERAEGRPFLVILGGKGIGKSFAASFAYYRWCAREFFDGDSWLMPDRWSQKLFSAERSLEWKHALEVANGSYMNGVPEWVYADFLVIDDLASEDATQTAKTRVNFVISKRYELQRPTIITGNMDRTALWNLYGSRVGERLAEFGVIADVDGEDLRRGLKNE